MRWRKSLNHLTNWFVVGAFSTFLSWAITAGWLYLKHYVGGQWPIALIIYLLVVGCVISIRR